MTDLPLALAERVRNGDRLVGVLVRTPCEEIVEMAALAGHDFVLIDCEHGPADVESLRRHITAAQVRGVETIVRVGQNEPALVLRALDAGASGILAPHVDTAQQAADLVRECHYPPLGERGFATYSRAGNYGQTSASDHRARLERGTLVLVMPESPLSARNAEDIFAVTGVDGYMIGVADLTASSGSEDPGVQDSMGLIHTSGRRTGRARFDIVADKRGARAAIEDGAQVIVYNFTAAVMSQLQDLATL